MSALAPHPFAVVLAALMQHQGYHGHGGGQGEKACENACCRPYAPLDEPPEPLVVPDPIVLPRGIPSGPKQCRRRSQRIVQRWLRRAGSAERARLP